MAHEVSVRMRGTRQRMAWANGTVGAMPLRLRNGYGPRIGSIVGDLGPDRIRLTFAGPLENGTLRGSVAGNQCELAVRPGSAIGHVGQVAVQLAWSPPMGLPLHVSGAKGAAVVNLRVDNARLIRVVEGNCEQPAGAVVAVAVLMQCADPGVWARLVSYLPWRSSAARPVPG